MLNFINLAQNASQGMGDWSGILMIIAMVVIFYFFMIRPQQKRQKEIKKQREAMQAGDRVVTAGGIHGKVKEVAEAHVIIEAAPGVSLKVDKASVFPVAEPQVAKK